jgi:perosamine synthetase
MRDPEFLPYGRQDVREEDVEAVVAVLQSEWLTTGPAVGRFEEAVARSVRAAHAVAVSSGTAGLHAAYAAAGIQPGDEVIVPAMTFAATSNAALYLGAQPVFADVLPDSLLIDPREVERKLTSKTRAIVAVDYAGQPADYGALRAIAAERGIPLVADACHSLGATFDGVPVGSIADLTVFSFHPVKTITTGEGGMVTTQDPERARYMRAFRNHGITTDHRERAAAGSVSYEMVLLGFNYRMTDFQAALGTSQLGRLDSILSRRRSLAALYDRELEGVDILTPLSSHADRSHARHLYPVLLDLSRLTTSRDELIRRLRGSAIGANVHYVPPYLHPYYRDRLGTGPGLCPVAEAAFARLLTLPLFPAMKDDDVLRVVEALKALA